MPSLIRHSLSIRHIKMLDHGEVFAAEHKVNVRQDPATGNEKD